MFHFRAKKSLYQYQSRNLQLNLEPGWVEYKFENQSIDDPITFIKEKKGVGALQISLATAKHGERFNINEWLKRNKQEYITAIKTYKLGEWMVYEYEDAKDGKYIKYIQLTKLNVIVYITYNCEASDLDEKELNEAIIIAKSVHVITNT